MNSNINIFWTLWLQIKPIYNMATRMVQQVLQTLEVLEGLVQLVPKE